MGGDKEGQANLTETMDDNNNKSDGLYVGIIAIGLLSRKSVNRLWKLVSIRTEVRRSVGLISGVPFLPRRELWKIRNEK